MKTSIKTIIVLITINLIISGASIAQESSQVEADITKSEIKAKEARERLEVDVALREQLKELEKLSVPQPVPSQVSVSVPEIVIPSFTNTTSSGDSVLVIPTNQMETEDIIAVNEDMNVMSRIFEENLEKAGLAQSGNRWFSSGYGYIGDPFSHWRYGNSNLQTMYLQGYGAIFMINVDFPLTPPPPEPNQVEEQTDESTDQVWEQTKKQMFEPQENIRRTQKTPKIEYDAEKVERLKATIIKSLRHAANIRAVRPDESVVVTITGSGEATGSTTVTRTMVIQGRGRSSTIQTTPASDSEDIDMSPPIKIVIRAKKVDIESVANGQIDMENFLGKVQILECPYLSSNASQIYMGGRASTAPTSSSSSRRGRSSGSSGGRGGVYIGEQR